MSFSSLVEMLTEFVDIFKTLRSLGEIEHALRTLIEIDFPIDLAIQFDLKTAVRRINTYPPFEDLKDEVIAKIDQLQAAQYEQKPKKKVEPEAVEKSSRFEKKAAVKKDEKPRKRAADDSESMAPPPKKGLLSKDEKARSMRQEDWVPKKRVAPTRQPRASPPQKPAEPVKKPVPPAPIVTSTSMQGFRIPKKQSAPTMASIEVKEAPEPLPTVPVMPAPVPLLSLVLEKPTKQTEAAKDAPKPVLVPISSLNVERPAWLSDAVIAWYK